MTFIRQLQCQIGIVWAPQLVTLIPGGWLLLRIAAKMVPYDKVRSGNVQIRPSTALDRFERNMVTVMAFFVIAWPWRAHRWLQPPV